MRRVECGLDAITERPERTAQGYKRFAAGPVPHRLAQLGADGARVAVVTVGCDPIRRNARHRRGRRRRSLLQTDRCAMAERKVSGYVTRARAEASISRYKQVVGDGLRSRTNEERATAVDVSVHPLNHMLKPGRLSCVRVAAPERVWGSCVHYLAPCNMLKSEGSRGAGRHAVQFRSHHCCPYELSASAHGGGGFIVPRPGRTR